MLNYTQAPYLDFLEHIHTSFKSLESVSYLNKMWGIAGVDVAANSGASVEIPTVSVDIADTSNTAAKKYILQDILLVAGTTTIFLLSGLKIAHLF